MSKVAWQDWPWLRGSDTRKESGEKSEVEEAPGGGREEERGGHSSCLESLYLLSLYDELSAAVDGGVR